METFKTISAIVGSVVLIVGIAAGIYQLGRKILGLILNKIMRGE